MPAVGSKGPGLIAALTRFHYATIMKLFVLVEDYLMRALTIKNIPDELYNELKSVAEQHHRSINSEVIVCLKRSLLPDKVSPLERLHAIRSLRSKIASNAVTTEDIDQAINEGRP